MKKKYSFWMSENIHRHHHRKTFYAFQVLIEWKCFTFFYFIFVALLNSTFGHMYVYFGELKVLVLSFTLLVSRVRLSSAYCMETRKYPISFVSHIHTLPKRENSASNALVLFSFNVKRLVVNCQTSIQVSNQIESTWFRSTTDFVLFFWVTHTHENYNFTIFLVSYFSHVQFLWKS